MPVTMEQVREVLETDEPDYEFAALLGHGALPHLRELVTGDNRLGLASKAAYLAGLIDGEEAAAVLSEAAGSGDVLTRLAVASTLTNVSARTRLRLADHLLSDDDVGIRKMTLKAVLATRRSADEEVHPELMRRVKEMARAEPNTSLRQIAMEIDQG